MSFLGPFEHTTGKTWGGTQVSPGALKAASVLGGLFGLDHILLRSPKTAFYKFFMNILTLGLWYWYDVIQVFSDIDFVKEYGYTIPIIGPVGLGTGIVGETKGPGSAPEGTPSPWIFLIYAILSFVPFGLSSFLAGDISGGAVKFFMTFFVLTTILGLVWTGYSFYYTFFKTESLLTRGTDRFFPASLFMKPFGPAPRLISPKMEAAEKLQAEIESKDSLITKLYNMVFGVIEKPILKAVVGVSEPIVSAAEQVNEAAKAPEVQAGGSLNSMALAVATQQGGGPDSLSKYMFLAAAGIVFVGSISATYIRFWKSKKNDPTENSKRNDIPPEGFLDDVPPGPRVL